MKRYIEFFDDAKTSAVEKLNNFLENLSKGSIYKVAGYQANTDCAYILLEVENELANQLDEPQPVKVPQFVAEKIEYFKKTGDWDLFQAMDSLFGRRETREWLEYKNNQETFARAWLDDYEVEEEKRYLVKVKGVVGAYLNYDNINELWNFNRKQDGLAVHSYHTRKELEEADFGWVFDCPGIEIEKVE